MATAMLAPTPALLSAFAPELSGLSDPELQALIDRAEHRVAESFYGDQYNEAWHLSAAHIGVLGLSTAGSAAGGGAVRRKKVGDLEVEYDVTSAAQLPPQYAGSRYGAELWYIVQARRWLALPMTF